MLTPSELRVTRPRIGGSGHRQPRLLAHARALGLLLVIVLVSAGCGRREEIVYVDAPGEGASSPVSRGTDPRVHRDGAHEPAADVQIGPGELQDGAATYTPIGSSGSPLVHADGTPHVPATVAIANERRSSASEAATTSSGARGAAATAPTPGAAAAIRAAASPTPPARLALGTGLGATAGTPVPDSALAVDDEDQSQATIVGKIESIVGSTLKIQTQAGTQPVRLADRAKVERDALGSTNDLKPGQFVGIVHTPSGPADSVRLYATGPSMPRAGVVPIVGSRSGQVTTFGSIVKLEFGGLVLNTGSQTTTVTLPTGVPILRPTPQGTSDLAAGAQVIATGPVGTDGSLTATAVRVIGESRPIVSETRPGR